MLWLGSVPSATNISLPVVTGISVLITSSCKDDFDATIPKFPRNAMLAARSDKFVGKGEASLEERGASPKIEIIRINDKNLIKENLLLASTLNTGIA
jgi:hypothetical protein